MELSMQLETPAVDGARPHKATGRLFAPKIVVCSNYADLRSADDSLIATVTWKSTVSVKVLKQSDE